MPASSALDAKVLSMPKTASPSGLLGGQQQLVDHRAGVALRQHGDLSSPEDASKSASMASSTTNESWVIRVTSPPPPRRCRLRRC